MQKIYILRHMYNFFDNKGRQQIENKFLGIYSSREELKKAIGRYYLLEGFNKYPKTCFIMEKWILDKDMSWKEGFIKDFEVIDFQCLEELYDENTGGFDVSSWLVGKKPNDETPEEFAERILNEKYGKGDWSLYEGLLEEYNDIILWRRLCFD